MPRCEAWTLLEWLCSYVFAKNLECDGKAEIALVVTAVTGDVELYISCCFC